MVVVMMMTTDGDQIDRIGDTHPKRKGTRRCEVKRDANTRRD